MESRLALALKLLRRWKDPFPMLTFLELRRALLDCTSVLDVGCGEASPLSGLGVAQLVGIEGYSPTYEKAKRAKTHHEVVLGDIRQLDSIFRANQFDACVALDVIEHLVKEDGLQLIRAMERIAAKTVVFFTPNGFLPQRHAENSDLQEHLSGWEPAEMRELGFRVIGTLGPKSLRGQYHVLKYKPRILWGMVALLGHVLSTHRHPERAAAILCVKNKASSGSTP